MSKSNPFDFTKAFEQFDPSQVAENIQNAFKFDFDSIKASQDKNLELLMSTNKTFADNTTAVLERQAEMLKQAMTEATEAAQNLASSSAPEEVASKQAELIQQAYEKALANSTEISEMAQKTQAEISEKVTKRIEESMDEFKKTLSNIA